MLEEFVTFFVVGFVAQMVDGALGMAYGVTATTALLSLGVPPAHASAATHMAEVFTTAASGSSHAFHRNIDWKLFRRLAPAGMAGGAVGVFVVTGFDGALLRPLIFTYLGVMGFYVLLRVGRPTVSRSMSPKLVAPLGAAGGFFDATGGGGWGPIVTTTLLGAGERPRYAIGTVNTAEFFVTVTISASFVLSFVTGHWRDAGDLAQHGAAVAGLVAGGVLAAPLAGYVVKIMPVRVLGILVGSLILALSGYQMAKYFGVL